MLTFTPMGASTSGKRATIKDVAAMCDVSAQTVSRVINNHPRVAPATRKRIEAAIAQLNYRPSALARGLQSNRSNTIGVLLAGLEHTGPAETLVGITDECGAQGMTVLIAELPGFDSFEPSDAIESLLEHRVDGIVMSVPEVGETVERITAELADVPVPIVLVRADEFSGFSGVTIDNTSAIHQVVDHLVGLGRRRIAHLAGPLGWREARARSLAWKDRLAHHGLEAEDVLLAEGDWSAESGARGMEALLGRVPDLDAVVVANDRMAFGALYVLDKHGRSVPDDVAVTGFDDIHEAQWSTPSLTSVRQPLNHLGRSAVRTVLAQSEDPTRPITAESLRCTLVVRESSAGAAHASWPTSSD